MLLPVQAISQQSGLKRLFHLVWPALPFLLIPFSFIQSLMNGEGLFSFEVPFIQWSREGKALGNGEHHPTCEMRMEGDISSAQMPYVTLPPQHEDLPSLT